MNEYFKEKKLRLIEEIIECDSVHLEILYEILINEDYDYVPDLFKTREEFDEFIEKGKPNKCCVKEEDND